MIVVACNTATVHAIGHLRETFPDVPFVGVVPVVKTLARRTRTGTIAVLSTPATSREPVPCRASSASSRRTRT